MTALTLSNGFKSNYILKLKSNKKFTMVGFVMNLLSAPLFLIAYIIFSSQMINRKENLNSVSQESYMAYQSFNKMYIIIPALAIAIAVIIGVFIALNTFDYLYKRSNVDMYLALPLTTKQRFFSDFLAGATSYLIPYLASGIVTMILSFIAQPIAKKAFSKTSAYLSLLDNNIPYAMFKLILFGLIIMLSVYVITVLVTTLCGNIIECIMYTGLINIFVPLSIFVCGELLLRDLYGMDSISSFLPLIHKTSPIGSIICIASKFISKQYNKEINQYTYWMIPFFILTFVLFVLSYFVYKKRKAEQVGKPVVFKAFYYIVTTLVIFTISGVFVISAGYNDLEKNIVPLIITSATIFFIFEVASNRGFKKIWKGAIRYAVTIISFLALIVISNESEGFGAVYRVPKANNVASVSINYHGNNCLIDLEQENLVFKDREIINTVVDFHKDVVKNHKENVNKGIDDKNNDFNHEGYSYISMVYNMKNGSVITRTYYINDKIYSKLYSIDLNDEFIDKIDKIKNKTNFSKEIRQIVKDELGNYIINTYYFSDRQQFIGFHDAVKKDMKEMTFEQYIKTDEESTDIILDNMSLHIGKDNFPNTIKYLEDMGISITKSATSP